MVIITLLRTPGGGGALFFRRLGLSTGLISESTMSRVSSSLKGFVSSSSFSVNIVIWDLARRSLNRDLGKAGEYVWFSLKIVMLVDGDGE